MAHDLKRPRFIIAGTVTNSRLKFLSLFVCELISSNTPAKRTCARLGFGFLLLIKCLNIVVIIPIEKGLPNERLFMRTGAGKDQHQLDGDSFRERILVFLPRTLQDTYLR